VNPRSSPALERLTLLVAEFHRSVRAGMVAALAASFDAIAPSGL
jgi:hypothetical protein